MRYSHITYRFHSAKQKAWSRNYPVIMLFSFDWPKKLRGKSTLAFKMISPILRIRVIEGCWIKDGYALNNGSIRLLMKLMKNWAKHHTLQSCWFIHYVLHPPRLSSSPCPAMRFLISDKFSCRDGFSLDIAILFFCNTAWSKVDDLLLVVMKEQQAPIMMGSNHSGADIQKHKMTSKLQPLPCFDYFLSISHLRFKSNIFM